jgi:type IV pilus assembly protein PilB
MKTLDMRRVAAAQDALDRVPGAVARRLGLLPLAVEDDTLRVAARDMDDMAAQDQLESVVGMRIEAVPVESVDALETALRRYYPDTSVFGEGDGALVLLDRIVNRAMQIRASDIHIDPTAEAGVVRMRVDGRMRLDRQLDAATTAELIAAVKVMASLDIAEKRTPLDGNISMESMGDEVNLRVATIPTIHGERVTLRLLSREQVDDLQGLASLGMGPEHYSLFLRTLAYPSGVIILSGPTGSGKTTTLYASLRHLRGSGALHLVSIEDPVEMPVPGVTQIRVDADSDRVTFNGALRSVLRHDPDVIMIGEIRDAESADIAVKAALTGHLVLSTLHTNDSVGVLTRLVNLGVSPYLVASTLRLAVAQRLVRRPCPYCMELAEPTPEARHLFGWDEDPDVRVPEPHGCSYCENTGHTGRLGLFEMVPLTASVRRLIVEGRSEDELARHVFEEQGNTTLRQDGAAKVLQGDTTVAEVQRVTLV